MISLRQIGDHRERREEMTETQALTELTVFVQTVTKYHADLQFVSLILFLAGLVVGAEWMKDKGLI